MPFTTVFGNLFGAANRRKKKLVREQAVHDAKWAIEGWGSFGLRFRVDGYSPNDWLGVPIDHGETPKEDKITPKPLIHHDLHPLATYRALGLSKVVDHWVPCVASEGWSKLTQDRPLVPKELGPSKQWGHIEHPEFWKEIVKMLHTHDSNGAHGQGLLQHAGWAGNLIPFEAMPGAQVERYSATPNTTCHPNTALWLKDQGLWTKDHLVPSLGNWDGLFPLAGCSFLQWNDTTPVPIAYVQGWIEPLLAHFPLSPEQKVNLVGQALLSFGKFSWDKHFATLCEPHLAGIDMDLVYAVCGMPSPANPLEATVSLLTQDLRVGFDNTGRYVPSAATPFEMHAGLMMLADIQPPQNRAELYLLADVTKKVDMGIISAPEETLSLPDLTC